MTSRSKPTQLPGHPRMNGYWHASEAWPGEAVIPDWCQATPELKREYLAGVEEFRAWSKTAIGRKALKRRGKYEG